MKKILLAVFLFCGCFASAQIVNIPDPVFKDYLVSFDNGEYDTNGDGEIQESEAQAITSLGIFDMDIYDLTGLQSFTSLDTLMIIDLPITALDLSGMSSLQYADLNCAHLHDVNVTNCSNLVQLYIASPTDISALDSLTSLTLAGAHKLKFIHCDRLSLLDLDLRQCDSLVTFEMSSGRMGTVNVSGLTKFETFHFEGYVSTLTADNAIALKNITEGSENEGGHIDNMSIINSPGIEQISLVFNGPSLDLSHCPNLFHLNLGASYLRYLNIKNGSTISIPTQNLWVNVSDNPNPLPLYVCTDDAETADVTSVLTQENTAGLTLNVNPFCTAWPGGDYNTIQGKVSLDINNDGCDVSDPGISNIAVRFSDGTHNTLRYTNAPGNYNFEDFAGNFTLTPYFPYPYFSISPTSANVVFDTANHIIDTKDFCITANGVHNQVDVILLPYGTGRARPGFGADYELTFRNRGTTTLSGNININFDNAKTTFAAASLPPSSQLPAQLSWNYSNLMPFERRSIIVSFHILATPVNNIGDTLTYLATINPSAGDETPADNSFILPQRVTGAYDPNEKQCIEGNKIDITNLQKPLHYFIHFQNLGTDTAFNIVVTDTLAGNFDWESFDFISSSHPCRVTRKDNRLEFYFQNIKLPYQSIDDQGSNGFVAFEVKPKSTLLVGDSINNTASIYFDFNPPVVTNRATTIVSDLSTVPVKLEYFSLSSKERNNLLTWKVTSSDLSTTFNIERSGDAVHFSNIGNLTATEQRCQLPFNFSDDKALTGKNYYRIKITDANGVSFYSKTLVTGKTTSGFEVNAIVSNQSSTTLYLDVLKDQAIQLNIIAADGKLLYSQSKTIAAGSGQLNLKTGNLANGVYTLIVYTNDGELLSKRFIK